MDRVNFFLICFCLHIGTTNYARSKARLLFIARLNSVVKLDGPYEVCPVTFINSTFIFQLKSSNS